MAGTEPGSPVPNRRMTCGLPAALSTILTEPVRAPVAVGVKVTLMVQVSLAETEVQSFVCAKSPVAETLVTVSVESPLSVSVTVFAALVVLVARTPRFNSTLERRTFAPTAPEVPVPKSRARRMPLTVTSDMLSNPLREPAKVGVKVTVMVQLLLPASELPQLLV